MVQYNIILHTALQWLEQNIDQGLHSQKTTSCPDGWGMGCLNFVAILWPVKIDLYYCKISIKFELRAKITREMGPAPNTANPKPKYHKHSKVPIVSIFMGVFCIYWQIDFFHSQASCTVDISLFIGKWSSAMVEYIYLDNIIHTNSRYYGRIQNLSAVYSWKWDPPTSYILIHNIYVNNNFIRNVLKL